MSPLHYTCAFRTESGVEIFRPRDEDLRYGNLQGDRGEKDNNMAMKYKYDARATCFEPQEPLYEPTPETLEKNLEKVRVLTPQNTSKYELRLINKAILKEYASP